MFNPFRQEDPDLNEAIASIYEEMKVLHSDDDDYAKMTAQLDKLYALKPKALDPNTLVTVCGNIAIGVAVLKFEKTGVVTSKIWSFLQKI